MFSRGAPVGDAVMLDTDSVTAVGDSSSAHGSWVTDDVVQSEVEVDWSRTLRLRSAARSFPSASTTAASAAKARSSASCALRSVRLHTRSLRYS